MLVEIISWVTSNVSRHTTTESCGIHSQDCKAGTFLTGLSSVRHNKQVCSVCCEVLAYTTPLLTWLLDDSRHLEKNLGGRSVFCGQYCVGTNFSSRVISVRSHTDNQDWDSSTGSRMERRKNMSPAHSDGLKKVVKTHYTLVNFKPGGSPHQFSTKMIALLTLPPSQLGCWITVEHLGCKTWLVCQVSDTINQCGLSVVWCKLA